MTDFLALLAGWLTPFLAGIALDQILRPDAKQRLADTLRASAPLIASTTGYTAAWLGSLFGPLFSRRFLLVSFVLTSTFSVIALAVTWIYMDTPFYFVYQLMYYRPMPWIFSILIIFMASYITDVLSYAQTRFFLDVMRVKPRVIPFFLILYADVCLSLSVFVLIFPIALGLALYNYDRNLSISERVALWTEAYSGALPPAYQEGAAPNHVMWSFAPSESYLSWRSEFMKRMGDGGLLLPFSWSHNISGHVSSGERGSVEETISRIQQKFPNIRIIADGHAIDLTRHFADRDLPESWNKSLSTQASVPFRYVPPAIDPKMPANVFYATHRVEVASYAAAAPFSVFYQFALMEVTGCLRDTVTSLFRIYCVTGPGMFYRYVQQMQQEDNLNNISDNAFQPMGERDSFVITTPLVTCFLTTVWIVIMVAVCLITRIISSAARLVLPVYWPFADRVVDINRQPLSCIGFAVSTLFVLLSILEMISK